LFRVYIDEAGDRGHQPASSKHFVVSAVVARDAYDAVVRGQLTILRTALSGFSGCCMPEIPHPPTPTSEVGTSQPPADR